MSILPCSLLWLLSIIVSLYSTIHDDVMSFFSPGLLLKTALASLLLIFLVHGAAAQSGADTCHVYGLDLAKSSRALKTVEKAESEEAIAKALSAAQTIFPELQPTTGEDELTTHHYPFPRPQLVLPASPYYTHHPLPSPTDNAAPSPTP